MDVTGVTAIAPGTLPVAWGTVGWRTSATMLMDAALVRELRMPAGTVGVAPPAIPPALAPAVVSAVTSIIVAAPAVAIAAAAAEAVQAVSPLRMDLPTTSIAALAASAPVLSAAAAATPNRPTTGTSWIRPSTVAATTTPVTVLPIVFDSIGATPTEADSGSSGAGHPPTRRDDDAEEPDPAAAAAEDVFDARTGLGGRPGPDHARIMRLIEAG